ncbi:MAG: type II toxin-antitoxin system HicB family antitoxin [Armatimonadetes bacterium]|nr:type II toxin-antitoxin system HicB family antitoxin [Armatimonadota bacterium]
MFPYKINIFYSQEDKGYIANISELKGCSAFGPTPEESLKEIKIAAKLWLETAKKNKIPIPHPKAHKYSGKILIRTLPAIHQKLIEKAEEEHLSLNQYINYLLAIA